MSNMESNKKGKGIKKLKLFLVCFPFSLRDSKYFLKLSMFWSIPIWQETMAIVKWSKELMGTSFLPTSVSAEMDGALILKTQFLIAIYPTVRKRAKLWQHFFCLWFQLRLLLFVAVHSAGVECVKDATTDKKGRKMTANWWNSSMVVCLRENMWCKSNKWCTKVCDLRSKTVLSFRCPRSSILSIIIGQQELKLSNKLRTFEKHRSHSGTESRM